MPGCEQSGCPSTVPVCLQTALTGLRLELSHHLAKLPRVQLHHRMEGENILAAKPELQYQKLAKAKPTKHRTSHRHFCQPENRRNETLVVPKLPEPQGELSVSFSLTNTRRVGCDLHPDLRTTKAAEGPAPLPAGLHQHKGWATEKS